MAFKKKNPGKWLQKVFSFQPAKLPPQNNSTLPQPTDLKVNLPPIINDPQPEAKTEIFSRFRQNEGG